MRSALLRLATAAAAAALAGGGCTGPGGGETATPASPSAPASDADAAPCTRPYAKASPWNTPIPRQADSRARALSGIDGPLTSDPTQYTYPVYEVDADDERDAVEISGWFSDVRHGGRRMENLEAPTVSLPLPSDAEAAAGSDGQIVLVDPRTGDEWGLWRLEREGGRWSATNGYHYNTRWSGVPPLSEGGSAFVSRGAGVPYLAGLVRPCELRRGHIDHALAFAYDAPSADFVYPATKSDGKGNGPTALPEGTRLQLDPAIRETEIRAWGCSGPCLTIARALQRHGMYVVDNSGRPKIMLEYEGTANWRGLVDESTVSPIPLSAFHVVTVWR